MSITHPGADLWRFLVQYPPIRWRKREIAVLDFKIDRLLIAQRMAWEAGDTTHVESLKTRIQHAQINIQRFVREIREIEAGVDPRDVSGL